MESLSLPETFVQLHAQLGHQCRTLSTAAGRHTEVCVNKQTGSPDKIEESTSTTAVTQHFVKMVDIVQSMIPMLANQTHSDTGPALARRLGQATQVRITQQRRLDWRIHMFFFAIVTPDLILTLTQAVGAACADFLRDPLDTERTNQLTSRLDDVQAILQLCSRGAVACSHAATALMQLQVDLDTAALFARAGSGEQAKTPPPSSVNLVLWKAKQRAFGNIRETALEKIREVLTDVQALVS